ncbi:cation diffusion facilitator CzcD-associated flavoprotein CzcO [Sediminihabitans luteus]|uniref:Cation diffusion facilitator CzcD-associated flavoprotein CzcO n=1 Tax=Sediminihabitans luteus TaxID=1138585 RepID=A0A2M9D1F1_9CELL|nr:FAD-dependent oxidoreductase [Sediminihabitans luteus]PJJ77818.1 cation diffusion facilitator CzcD-associated flavoprotein CzcO [Sediminihabitans luteus]GII99824.1 monooxygenase [Sediminihabitans luteus]
MAPTPSAPTSTPTSPLTSPRVAVIGAGPSGLATLKALLDRGVNAWAYDAGDVPGGLWVLGGAGGRSPAYSTLHLNTSRTRTEFTDHPMPADWPHFPRHDRVAGYLADYARTFGLVERTRFRHEVTSVRAAGATSGTDDGRHAGWEVTATGPDGTSTDHYDAVVVANGHNAAPRWPEPAYPGTFDGDQMHSNDYRGPEQLAGRHVVVVGGGNSAMDIAVDASYAAAETHLSLRHGVWVVPKQVFGRPSDTLNGALAKHLPWRLRQRISETTIGFAAGRPESHGLPRPTRGFLEGHPTLSDALYARVAHGEIGVRPGVERLDGDAVVFTDGRRERADLVVWCTGYRVDVPFLDPAVLAPGADRLMLYRHVFHLDQPGLYFVGLMQSTGAALPVVEAQGRLVAAHVAGEYALPSHADQRAACVRELRAARARWGESRPAMRVDFDGYVALAARELVDGARRASRGQGVAFAPAAPQSTTPTPAAREAARDGTPHGETPQDDTTTTHEKADAR